LLSEFYATRLYMPITVLCEIVVPVRDSDGQAL